MEERTELGARLKQLRAGRHLSQLDVATRTGIPLSTIAMYELRKRVPRYEQLKTLCEFYTGLTENSVELRCACRYRRLYHSPAEAVKTSA